MKRIEKIFAGHFMNAKFTSASITINPDWYLTFYPESSSISISPQGNSQKNLDACLQLRDFLIEALAEE